MRPVNRLQPERRFDLCDPVLDASGGQIGLVVLIQRQANKVVPIQRAGVVKGIATARPGTDNILLSSFSIPALKVLQQRLPHYRRGLLYDTPPADWLHELRALEASSLHCAAKAVSDALLATASAHAVPLLCYTVNQPQAAQDLLRRGVSAIFTDRPDRLSHL